MCRAEHVAALERSGLGWLGAGAMLEIFLAALALPSTAQGQLAEQETSSAFADGSAAGSNALCLFNRVSAEARATPIGPSLPERASLADDQWDCRHVHEIAFPGALEQEIERTERLRDTVPSDDPARPEVYFRLAQLYLEVARQRACQAVRADDEVVEAQQAGAEDRVVELQQRRDELREVAEEWRDRAIESFYFIVQNLPGWKRADEALFYLALAFELAARMTDAPAQSDDFDLKARTVYNVLITQHPESRYVSNAFLAFADYYFNREADMTKALDYYEKVLGVPDNGLYGYSWYKKSWCFFFLGRHDDSVTAFAETQTFVQEHPEYPDSAELLQATKADVAAVLGALVNDWASAVCRAEADATTLAAVVWNAGAQFADDQGVRDVLFAAPEILVRIARFEDAAATHEQFARQYATGENADSRAPEALLTAISLRTALGEFVEAKADIELLDSTFGADAALHRKAAEAWFAVGEELTEDGDPAAMIAHEEMYLDQYAEAGGKDLALRATVRIAVAHHELATCAADATRAQRRVCGEHAMQAHDYLVQAMAFVDIPEPQDAGAVLDGMSAVPPQRAATLQAVAALVDAAGEGDESQESAQANRAARAQKAAEALAQVHFLLGDEVFEAFQALVLPEFDPDDWHPPAGACAQLRASAENVRVCLAMEKYKLWTEEIVVPFLRDCDAKIRQARRSWDAIAFLGAPAWEAAAASRIGDMYRRLVGLLKDVSSASPLRILDDPSLAAAYRQQIELLTEPLLQQAREAYMFCRRTAAREQVGADYAAHCEAALYEIDPSQFSVQAEAYAAPTLTGIHYAVPDIGLGAAAAVDGPTEPMLAPVPGVATLDGNAAFRFFSAAPP